VKLRALHVTELVVIAFPVTSETAIWTVSPINAIVDVAPRLEAHQVTIGATLSMVTPHPPVGVEEKEAIALPSEFNVTPDTAQVTVSVPGGGALDVTVTIPL